MKALLLVTRDDKSTAQFPITTAVQLGKKTGGFDVVLRRPEGTEEPLGITDPAVSSKHAMIYMEGEKLFIKDLGSTNGTYVNNRGLPNWKPRTGSEPLEITGGSCIRIGTTEMEIKVEVITDKDLLKKLMEMAEREKQLVEALQQKHPSKEKEEAERLAKSFQVILDIKDNCCNTRTRVKDLDSRLANLAMYLEGYQEFLSEIKVTRGRFGVRFSEESLREEDLLDLKNFCIRFVEMWSAKFMKEGQSG